MSDDPARARFFAVQAVRLSGLVLVLLAVAILARKIDLPETAGYVLLVIGALDALIMPRVLARRWRTPER